MKYIDAVDVQIKGGDGGNGCMSSYYDNLTSKRSPDGGNGGKGGDVYIQGSKHINHLLSLYAQKTLQAGNGVHGGSNNCYGKAGADLTIDVPLGTLCTVGEKIYDVLTEEPFRILNGGTGGKGSKLFPDGSMKIGEKGQQETVQFKLKTIGDIGLVGLPNAGKSSLLNLITNAHVAVADYPFTTTKPQLGTWHGLVLVDIPGLIEGASTGKGMGLRFLTHISRCKMIIVMIDVNTEDPMHSYHILMKELASYGIHIPLFGVVLNKIENCKSSRYRQIAYEFKAIGIRTYNISILKKVGIEKLERCLWKAYQSIIKTWKRD